MAVLADLPELVGFFSYSRDDDRESDGALSALRHRIQGELRGQLGHRKLKLWQDREAIPAGTLWEKQITAAIAQSVFFIPIITPTVVKSDNCQFELDSFLRRESDLERSDLVFPILYITVHELQDSLKVKDSRVLSVIAQRQFLDWRELRHRDITSETVKREIEWFCSHICAALRQPRESRQERLDREQRERNSKPVPVMTPPPIVVTPPEPPTSEPPKPKPPEPPPSQPMPPEGPGIGTVLTATPSVATAIGKPIDKTGLAMALALFAVLPTIIGVVWGWWYLLAALLCLGGAIAVVVALLSKYSGQFVATVGFIVLASIAWSLWTGNCGVLMVRWWPSFLAPLQRMCQTPTPPDTTLFNPNLVHPGTAPR